MWLAGNAIVPKEGFLSWSEPLFNYCERGQDPAFWAEPLNAASNAAFLVAAVSAGLVFARLPPEGPDRRPGTRAVLWLLVGLVGAIGIGSFLFHTFATRWALLADVLPITLFMVVYLAFALRVMLGAGWLAIGIILPVFLVSGGLAGDLTCGPIAVAADGRGLGGRPCLNGTLGYAPALLALWIIGGLAVSRRIEGGRELLIAGGVFLVSATFRTLDWELCAHVSVLGHDRGTHIFWHLLNAVTLYLLLMAGIRQIETRRSASAGAHGD